MGINSYGRGITVFTDLLPRSSPLEEDAGNVLVVGYAFGLLKLISWSDMGEEAIGCSGWCDSVVATTKAVMDRMYSEVWRAVIQDRRLMQS